MSRNLVSGRDVTPSLDELDADLFKGRGVGGGPDAVGVATSVLGLLQGQMQGRLAILSKSTEYSITIKEAKGKSSIISNQKK